jgi:hypothetical protein
MKTRITSQVGTRFRRAVARRGGWQGRRGAIGWSLAYLVFGGGLVGAVVIYLLVKMIGG